MPRITEAAAKKAAAIHAELKASVDAGRANRDLSDEGRARVLARSYQKATDAMSALRSEFEAEQAALAKRLNREVFGAASTAGADAIALRDAVDRVSRIETPDEAARLMKFALDNGDDVFARAIAQEAHRNTSTILGAGWQPVLQSYLEEKPEAATKLQQLEGPTSQATFGMGDDPEGHFFLVAPKELERMPPGVVRSLAEEPEPSTRETQVDRNREISKTIAQAQGGYSWLDHHQGLQ